MILAPLRAYRSVRSATGFSPLAVAGLFYEVAVKTGIVNADTVLFAVRQIVPRMVRRARGADDSALQEMVALARSRVPVDTGNLLNGITGETTDEYHIFTASAVRGEGADYARYVHFGTRPGVRGRKVSYQARAGLLSGPVTGFEQVARPSSPRTRRQYRGHPGTQAKPFFFNSAREVMERRFMTFEGMAGDAAREVGLDG